MKVPSTQKVANKAHSALGLVLLGTVASCSRGETVPAPPSARVAPSSTIAAGQPSSVGPAVLSQAAMERITNMDLLVVAAIRKKDAVALRAMTTEGLDPTVALGSVSSTECVGALVGVEARDDGAVARHVLGHAETQGPCQGAHELHLRYVKHDDQLRLAQAYRYGW
jgi:hypothetical protein